MCTLIHTHKTCMGTLKQSYVTKTNKKNAATKNSNCPMKAGEIKKCGRRPVQPAELFQIYHGQKICLSSSVQGILSLFCTSFLCQSQLTFPHRVTGCLGLFQQSTKHQATSQLPITRLSTLSQQLKVENSIRNPTCAMPGVQHQDPPLGCRNQEGSSHSNNSLKNAQSVGSWHAAEYLPCVSCMGMIHRSWDSSTMGSLASSMMISTLSGLPMLGTKGWMCPWLPFPSANWAKHHMPRKTDNCSKKAPSLQHWATLRQQSKNRTPHKLQACFKRSPKFEVSAKYCTTIDQTAFRTARDLCIEGSAPLLLSTCTLNSTVV